MAKKKGGKQKLRTTFRKNRSGRTRDHSLTRKYHEGDDQIENLKKGERVSGKGKLTRKRTVIGIEAEEGSEGTSIYREIESTTCQEGLVVHVHGLNCKVESADGTIYECVIRRILKTLATEQRSAVVTGDRVLFEPEAGNKGVIERVEPRRTVLTRESKRRQHILAANVDQVFIVSSAAYPSLKPHLIDRMLVVAEQANLTPIICINKTDLVDLVDLVPLVGEYTTLGYQVLLTSVKTGQGIALLRQLVRDKRNVVTGQSGVGKSSLLNAIEPSLHLRVGYVSQENEKGRHTTTSSQLIRLQEGGHIVDTPGIRQFQLWDIISREVANYFCEFRPHLANCKFADCTHIHEEGCAVLEKIKIGQISPRRYRSYLQLFREGEGAS
ncbi:MAG: ribosome small subunit-dependent GTPase A [Pirellulaceae bacterium]|nr:ribosome small subunit-dependent GTPase A [Pirellulaceae bacterium]